MSAAGYDFAPLPDRPRVVARPQARLDLRQPGMLFGAIRVEYALEQPVHVGAGRKAVYDGRPVRAQMRRGEALIVPGSSWKGLTRARFEAITRACAGQAPRRQKGLVSNSFPGYSAELSRAAQGHPVFSNCRTRAGHPAPRVCPACALFGLMNRRSRVQFDDLVADGEPVVLPMAQQFGPRLHHLAEPKDVAVDHQRQSLTVGALKGRKFHGGAGPPPVGQPMQVEAIPRGRTLTGALRLTNVSPAELGGLLVALGFARASYVKVGAGKSLGFGRVVPQAIAFDLRDHRRKALTPDPAAWDAAHAASEDRWGPGEEALLSMHRRRGW